VHDHGPRGAPRAMVVHGSDGMDELTITGRSTVWELRDGDVSQYHLDPRDLGLAIVDIDQLKGGDAAANARIAREVFEGEPGPCRDIVALNAAAGLVVAGTAGDMAEGLALACSAIDEGRAATALDRLVEVSAG
jgi:anthranilate phosphoribosyltransferase